ncbi:MAG TPA: hypothetical protein VKV73_27525 [Chloroflexota bacterium]|nr:hypothetical protein [Chloroflexota bacterium]
MEDLAAAGDRGEFRASPAGGLLVASKTEPWCQWLHAGLGVTGVTHQLAVEGATQAEGGLQRCHQ